MIKLLILVLVFGWVAEPDREPAEALEKLREKLEGGQILTGEMRHEFEDRQTGVTEEHSGRIWIGQDRYKIDVGQQQVLVIDDISRVYNSSENRLIISEYEPEEDDFAPSRLLNLSDDIFSMNQEREGDRIRIQLRTDDPFEILRTVDIELTEDLIPVSIEAVDQTDNRYSTYFSDAEFQETEEGIFELDYPEDAEVVDMRE